MDKLQVRVQVTFWILIQTCSIFRLQQTLLLDIGNTKLRNLQQGQNILPKCSDSAFIQNTSPSWQPITERRNEEAGECEHVLGVCMCPVSTISKWLTVQKGGNAGVNCSGLYQVHIHYFKIFHQTDRQTDWLTDGKKKRLLNLFDLYQVHIHYYCLDCHVIAAYSNCLTL